MKTDDLILMLATQAGPAPHAIVARRLAPALALGAVGAVALVLGTLGPYPGHLLGEPAVWLKFAYAGALAAAGMVLTGQLARPVARTAAGMRVLLTVLLVMGLLGALAWWGAAPEARPEVLLGRTWRTCPWLVAGVSLPTLASTLWALRGLAPTRPRTAGAAAGLLAGGVGTLAYALHCQEMSPTFVAVWYTAGIALSGGLGAVLGPRVLRW